MTGKLDMRVWEALLRRLGVGQDPFVKVGILQAHGAAGRHADSEATVVEVATIHEFGDGPIPERSFIRRVIREKECEILELQAKLTSQVVAGRLTMERALHLVGAFVAGEIKKRIADGEAIPPPLAPATVKAKVCELLGRARRRRRLRSLPAGGDEDALQLGGAPPPDRPRRGRAPWRRWRRSAGPCAAGGRHARSRAPVRTCRRARGTDRARPCSTAPAPRAPPRSTWLATDAAAGTATVAAGS